MTADLPIHEVLPELLGLLAAGPNAVLVAPPGAGKTTAVAPALLEQGWCTGRVLLLSPRRLAARAAAERIAGLAGERVGGRIGYATRLDSRQSAATRLLVVTQGIFVGMIEADPELAGVSAVLFDEVHERSLDGDFGLALVLDAQGALRPDLRLVAMSATLDGARFAALLGGAPVVESRGRSFSVELRHVGRGNGRIEDEMAAVCRTALAESDASDGGGVLAFLPGVAEIERTAERLKRLPEGVVLHRLHGTVDPAEQRRAIAPPAAGTRKLVLATAIAETSLTLDGVTAVVDSGLVRRPRYDRAAGMTRLATERVSQAAAAQRAGRAGRQRPGVAWRLWEEAATAGLMPFDPPEIAEADLSGLLLSCALWGVAEPGALKWLDPPSPAATTEARARLLAFGLVDADGRPTAHGRRVAALPVSPRIGHMLVAGAARGWGRTAAEAAVLLSERGVGGGEVDLEARLRRWRGERGERAEAARGLAGRWERMAADSPPRRAAAAPPASGRGEEVAGCIALAFPDRLARRRGADGADWLTVGGRGLRLDPAEPLAKAEWLAVAETAGSAAGARILSAAAIGQAQAEALFADRIEARAEVRFDPATGAAIAVRERRLGAVRLSGGGDPSADPAALAATLVEGVRRHGLALLPWNGGAAALRARAAYAGVDLSDGGLAARLDEWLPGLVAGKRRLGDVTAGALVQALEGLIGWERRQAIEAAAPSHLVTPAGSAHPIDYAAEGGPAVDVRVQAVFGLDRHPLVGSGAAAAPLVLRLTSPAGRPIQTTRDLPGFWRGSWAAVAKEMRGRYPRHPWPAEPWTAAATLRAKPRS